MNKRDLSKLEEWIDELNPHEEIYIRKDKNGKVCKVIMRRETNLIFIEEDDEL